MIREIKRVVHPVVSGVAAGHLLCLPAHSLGRRLTPCLRQQLCVLRQRQPHQGMTFREPGSDDAERAVEMARKDGAALAQRVSALETENRRLRAQLKGAA